MGAAVLAAVPYLGGCAEAVTAVVRPGRQVHPQTALSNAYHERFAAFKAAVHERGYL